MSGGGPGAPVRLGLYLIVLVVLFGASFAVAGAVVPDRVVGEWRQDQDADAGADRPDHQPQSGQSGGDPSGAGHGG